MRGASPTRSLREQGSAELPANSLFSRENTGNITKFRQLALLCAATSCVILLGLFREGRPPMPTRNREFQLPVNDMVTSFGQNARLKLLCGHRQVVVTGVAVGGSSP